MPAQLCLHPGPLRNLCTDISYKPLLVSDLVTPFQKAPHAAISKVRSFLQLTLNASAQPNVYLLIEIFKKTCFCPVIPTE